MSSYVHSIPGRLRIKTALVKKNPEQAGRVQKLLESIAGVCSVDINLVTGSVLVRYTPGDVSCEHLLAVMRKFGCFDKPQPVSFVELFEAPLAQEGPGIGHLLFRQLVEKQIERFAVTLVGALI